MGLQAQYGQVGSDLEVMMAACHSVRLHSPASLSRPKEASQTVPWRVQPHPTLPAFTGQAWALTPKPRTRARGPHSELEELDTGKGSWGSEGGQPSPTRWGRGVWWGVAGADAQQLPPETREKGTSSRSG